MEIEYTEKLLINFGENGKNLIPVVAQDAKSLRVLILAFVNKEAFEETQRSGYATFWSRTRGELWKKGQTSGDLLAIKDILINCEQNSLIYLVEPKGFGACHAKKADGKAHTSCYYRKIKNNKLEFIEK